LLRDLEPYGIKEMVQSGLVAIGRGSRSITTGPALRAAALTRKPEEEPMTAEVFYDDDADLSIIQGEGRRDRLRQPGPRALAVAARLGRRRGGRPEGGSKSRAKAEEQGLEGAHARPRRPPGPT
jgi:hypothetical protein